MELTFIVDDPCYTNNKTVSRDGKIQIYFFNTFIPWSLSFEHRCSLHHGARICGKTPNLPIISFQPSHWMVMISVQQYFGHFPRTRHSCFIAHFEPLYTALLQAFSIFCCILFSPLTIWIVNQDLEFVSVKRVLLSKCSYSLLLSNSEINVAAVSLKKSFSSLSCDNLCSDKWFQLEELPALFLKRLLKIRQEHFLKNH